MNRRQFVESLIAAAALPIDGVRGFTSAPGGAQAPATSVTPPRRPAPALWYGRAASKWVEALPVGNGRLGAMVFGDVGVERLQINDDTLWSGGPGGWDTPGAKIALAEVRRLALAGDYAAADKAAHGLMGTFTQSYLPLGDLWLTFEHGNLGRSYRRELRLGDAVAAVRYQVGDVRYTREVIASHPAGVIAVRIAADRPGLVTFDARAASALRHAVTVEDGVIRLRGVAPAHVEPSYYQADVPVQYGRDGGVPAGQWAAGEKPQPHKGRRTLPGMRFEMAVGVVTEGGTVSTSTTGIRVEGADAATLLLATATAFNGFDKDPARDGRDPGPIVVRQIAAARATAWPALRDAHVADHRALLIG
jgi:alpha-L-fucosidase 2